MSNDQNLVIYRYKFSSRSSFETILFLERKIGIELQVLTVHTSVLNF